MYRRHELDMGISVKRVNLEVDVKRKGTSVRSTRPEVSMPPSGADCSVVVMKLGNANGAKGVGYPLCGPWANWQQEELLGLRGTRQRSLGGTSRVNREVQARICEGLGA